jgi:hypothetical protein
MIVAYVFVAAGTCLPSRSLVRNVYSGSAIPAFRRHVTIYTPSVMTTGTGVEAILRFCLLNLRACNVDITDGRDFFITLLTWAQAPDIHTKSHKDWFWHSKIVSGG